MKIRDSPITSKDLWRQLKRKLRKEKNVKQKKRQKNLQKTSRISIFRDGL